MRTKEMLEKKDKQRKSKEGKKDNDKGNDNGVPQVEKAFKEKEVIIDTTVQEKNITNGYYNKSEKTRTKFTAFTNRTQNV